MINLLFLLILLINLFYNCHSFATWFVSDYCDRELNAGTIIMNNEAINDKERSVLVYRGNEELKSGSYYIPGETLNIKLSDHKGQYVFEVKNGKFINGGCAGATRSASRDTQLMIDDNETNDIHIKAGWTTGHTTVRITSSFVLKLNQNAEEEERRSLRSLRLLQEEEEEGDEKVIPKKKVNPKNIDWKQKAADQALELDPEKKAKKEYLKKKMYNIIEKKVDKDFLKPEGSVPTFKKVNKDVKKSSRGTDDDTNSKDDDDEIIKIIAKKIKKEKAKLRGAKYLPNMYLIDASDSSSSFSMYEWFYLIITLSITLFIGYRYRKEISKFVVTKLTGRAFHE